MHDSSVLTPDASLAIQRVNARHWPTLRQARRRARRHLRSGEVGLVGRYRKQLSGDVLELGSCGDRLTGVLAHQARSMTGIGVSTPTVALCRELYPGVRFLEQNLGDLDRFDDGQFNSVVAGRCALDRLGDGQRRRLLEQINRVLVDDGVLIFSSHNLLHESLVPTPARHALQRPHLAWRLPAALRNHAHVRSLQQREHGYAILNDPTANYGLLQYYVSRDVQERQLFEHDFLLLECVTASGESVSRGAHAYRHRELYYVARPLARLCDDEPLKAQSL